MEFSRKAIAEVGELREGLQQVEVRRDPENAKEYAEYLNDECKRLNRIIELQNKIIGERVEKELSVEMKEIMENADVRARILRDVERQKIETKATEYCNVTCTSCYFNVNGCGAGCTNDIW